MDAMLWPLLLLVLGLGLLCLEIFIPSGGVLSCLAAMAIVASIVTGFLEGVREGITILAVTMVLLPTVVAAAVRWWPHTPIGRLVLIPRPRDPDDVLPQSEQYRGLQRLIGEVGTARSKMLPSGPVRIENRTYDAVSAGLPIEPGQAVRVIDVRTHRLVVRPLGETEAVEEPPPAEDVLSRPIDSLGIDDPLA